jgi:hypothetical protein
VYQMTFRGGIKEVADRGFVVVVFFGHGSTTENHVEWTIDSEVDHMHYRHGEVLRMHCTSTC